MSQNNTLPSERAAVLAVIDPDAYTAAAYTSAWVDVKNFGRLMAILAVGDMASTSTVDFVVKSSAASNGGTPTTVASATQLTEAGTDSNKQVVVNIEVDKLTEGHRYVAVVMTVGTAASDAGAILLGFDPRYAPASDTDVSTVDEIVSA